jgi:hypothetical protein
MQVEKTSQSRLFYNKWTHRIECQQTGMNFLIRNIGYSKNYHTFSPDTYLIPRSLTKSDMDELEKLFKVLAPLLKRKQTEKNFQVRVEHDTASFFCKDQDLLAELTGKLGPWIVKITGPQTAEEYEFLLSNRSTKILCDNLPYNQFRYRVQFRDSFPLEKRQNFLKWAESYQDHIRFTDYSKDWFSGQKRMYFTNAKIYITEEKILSMISLYCGNNIKKIEEFVIRDRI